MRRELLPRDFPGRSSMPQLAGLHRQLPSRYKDVTQTESETATPNVCVVHCLALSGVSNPLPCSYVMDTVQHTRVICTISVGTECNVNVRLRFSPAGYHPTPDCSHAQTPSYPGHSRPHPGLLTGWRLSPPRAFTVRTGLGSALLGRTVSILPPKTRKNGLSFQTRFQKQGNFARK